MTIDVHTDDGAAASLADRAYLVLRERLTLLRIKPGDPIDDAAVGRELDVGRTPVREALKRLETDRLVIAYPRRGTFATGVDITDLAHITEIRLLLEPVAAHRAAERASARSAAVWPDLLDRLGRVDEAPADRIELVRLDVAVHRAIYRAAGNPHLDDVLVRFHDLATRILCLFLPRLPDVASHLRDLVPVVTAIRAGAAEEAAALVRGHVAAFESRVRAVI